MDKHGSAWTDSRHDFYSTVARSALMSLNRGAVKMY